jgi:hypothetical protein
VLGSAPRASCFLAAIAIAMLGMSSVADARDDGSYSQKLRKSSVGPSRGGFGPSDRAKADDRSRDSASQTTNSKQSSTEITGFGSAVEQMIGHCEEQAAELRKASLDVVTRAIQPTVDQRNALEIIRSIAAEAADSLAATCPKSIPPPLSERIEILSQVLDEIVGSLSALRPVVLNFYTSLDDEQKARVGVSSFLTSQPKSDGDSRYSNAFYDRIDPEQDAICGHWLTALRNWPIREIARGMTLSDEQHAALHNVAAANYRAAGDLLRTCPAEIRLTPLGRLDVEREKMRALRHGINAIQPVLAAFENTLNEDQKKSFDAMMQSAGAAIDQVGIRHQLQDRKGARARHSADAESGRH